MIYNIGMNFLKTILGYLKWHYGKALFSVFNLWNNLLLFLFNFFSIKSLLTNFFTPWKRLTETYPKFGIDLETIQTFFFVIIVNTIMRILGMFLRTIATIIGLVCCICFIMTLPIAIVLWISTPILIIISIFLGIILIIS